jgi:hypothetical protein
MNFPIYQFRPRNFFFFVFALVFLFLCFFQWFHKKRITRSDILDFIFVSLVFAGFMLFVCWFHLP